MTFDDEIDSFEYDIRYTSEYLGLPIGVGRRCSIDRTVQIFNENTFVYRFFAIGHSLDSLLHLYVRLTAKERNV